MATINVYEQYFEAEATFNGVERRAALVMLISESGGGNICYKAAVTLFPHRTEDDFAVSYDAYVEEVLYDAPGRRSRKREATLEKGLREHIDALAAGVGGKVFWEKPLREERRG